MSSLEGSQGGGLVKRELGFVNFGLGGFSYHLGTVRLYITLKFVVFFKKKCVAVAHEYSSFVTSSPPDGVGSEAVVI